MELVKFEGSIEEKEFNLEKTKTEVATKVKNSPNIQNILRQLDLDNLNTIISFGSSTTEEIAGLSDRILHSMETAKIEDSGQLLIQLNKIMDKFDIKDFEEKKQSLIGKIFNKTKDTIEALFKKYHTMGDEVDKIYVFLKQYEAEITNSNKKLDEMFEASLQYYEQLEQYIYAGELAIEEIKNNIIPKMEQQAMETGGKVDELKVKNLVQIQEMLEQRVYDLRLAEHIAIQSMPSIKTTQYGNYNLVRKINSAFIITLPVFKQCLIHTIMLKRQAVQAKAIKALDEKTNELLLRNAENTALQSKIMAGLASEGFTSVDTLEKTWQTILKGIEETKQIQNQEKQKRMEGSQRLAKLKQEYLEKKLIS